MDLVMQDLEFTQTALAVLIGIGLAASCGFRVFVPLLVVSGAANAGYLEVAENLRWLASPAAMIAFAVASVVEIGAYYVPWLDNALDAIASPLSAVAGAILFAASVTAGSIRSGSGRWRSLPGAERRRRCRAGPWRRDWHRRRRRAGWRILWSTLWRQLWARCFRYWRSWCRCWRWCCWLVVVAGMYYVGRRVVGSLFPRGPVRSVK